MGSPLLYDTVAVKAVSSAQNPFIVKYADQYVRINRMNTGALMIGKAGENASAALVRFDGNTIPKDLEYLKPEDLQTCQLKLKSFKYGIGDTINNYLSFKVYPCVNLWDTTVTWNKLFVDANNIIDYSKPIASFSGNLPFKDSNEVNLDFDKNTLIDWLVKEHYKVNTKQDTTFGFVIVPDENSNVIRKFLGQSISASLSDIFFNKITFTYKTNKGSDSTHSIKAAIELPVAKIVDPIPNYLNIQGGVSYKSRLFFDFSSLPKDIGVHQARLELHIDRKNSWLSNVGIDSAQSDLVAYVMKTAENTTPAKGDTLLYTYGYIEKGTDLFYFNQFAPAVEALIKNGNKGFVEISNIDFKAKYQYMDKYLFYSPTFSEESKRPTLKIIYARRPNYNTKSGENK
jgi:hypothetical protein